MDDPKWTVYGCYEVKARGAADEAPADSYAFVGYATTYRFSNPFGADARACGRADSVRLAQLLLLPAHQRAGHGERFMAAIRADLEATNCAELTVESPCDGMRALRDVVDAAAALDAAVFAPRAGWGDDGRMVAPAPAAAVTDLTDADVARVRSRARLTRGQVHRVYETLLLAGVGDDGGSDAGRAYRLLVKRRIWHDDEELRAVDDADTRKRLLEDAFQDARREYAATVRKLRARGALPSPPPPPLPQ